MRTPIAVGLVVAVIACSSSSSSSVSPDQASSDVAKAYCNAANTCSALYVQIGYGSVDTCASRLSGILKEALSANGTAATPSTYEACAAALASPSCDQLLSGITPSACQPQMGQLADGTACGDSSQCKSAYCKKGANSTCGACGEKSANGASCTVTDDCMQGSTCNASLQCVPYGTAGSSCDPNHPCLATLACKNSTCAPRDAAGQPCSPLPPPGSCDIFHGQVCNASNPLNPVCEMVATASAGQVCGDVNGTPTVCTGGSSCNALPMGTCEAPVPDGGACTAIGATCMGPAICQNGVCTLPDPSACH